MTNPIDDIENRQANIDMGRLACQVYKGAMQEASNWKEGFWASVAFFVAMFKQGEDQNET